MAKKIPPEMSNLKSKISKPQSLRVLVVEDSEDDVLLIIRELKKGGYNPVYERVETAAAMKKALKEKQWDIILCDYKLPKFNATSAIAVLKATNIDIPLLLVSGAIGEETAVECMRSGAQDYIMKGNLSRLCPAIARELEEADSRSKRKQAEEALRESEEIFRSLAENANDGILVAIGEGLQAYANKRASEITGYSVAELLKSTIKDLVHPDELEKIMERYRKRLAGEPIPSQYETIIIRKDGKSLPIEVTAAKTVWQGRPADLVIVRDITERKRAEEIILRSEKRFKTLYQESPIPIFTWQKKGDDFFLVDFNRAAILLTEGKAGTYMGNTALELYRKRPEIIDDMLRCFKEQSIIRRELVSQDFAPGRLLSVYYSYIPPDLIIIHAEDITERKRAEEALRKSEENFRLSLDDSPLGVRIMTAEGETLYANRAILDIYGYDSIEELRGTPLKKRYTLESYAEFKIRKEKRGRGEFGPFEYEISIVRKNGEVRHVQVFRKEVFWNGARQFQIIYQDITERKRAEDALHQSEEKYRTILENIEDGYYEVDLNGDLTFFNDSMCQIWGYPKEELMGMNYRQYTDAENAKKLFQAFNGVYRTGEPSQGFNWQIIRKDRTNRYIEASVSLLKDSSDKPTGFRGIIRDITERKRAEEALRSEQIMLTRTEGIAHVGSWEWNIVTDTVTWSDELFRIFQRDPWEGAPSFAEHPAFYHPDDMARLRQAVEAAVADGTPYELELRAIRKDGETRVCVARGIAEMVLGGRPVRLFGSLQDITERKRAEEALKQANEYLSLATTAGGVGVWDLDIFNNKLTWDDQMFRLYGAKPEEFGGAYEAWKSRVHPEDVKQGDAEVQMALRGEKEFDTVFRVIWPDGTIHYISARARVYHNAAGQPAKMVGTNYDITERKRAEEKLSESEGRYHNLIEHSPDAIFVNYQDSVILVNQACLKLFGARSEEELMGKSPFELFHPDFHKQIRERIHRLRDIGKPVPPIEEKIVRLDGGIVDVEVVAAPFLFGGINAIHVILRDITERKRAEETLRKSEEKYRSLVENAQEGVYQSTAVGRHITLNPAFARMLGYDSPQEVMATIKDIAQQLYVNPDDRKKLLELVNEKGSVTDFETEFYKKDGSRIWVSVNMHAVRDDQGRILYYQGIDQDITEKKKMEAERQENIERLRKSLGATINAMAVTVETRDPYTAGHQRRVADLARAIAVEMNLKSEQIDGARMASMIHDIGKISIPSEILTKPTPLTVLEFNLIKTHPESGYNILKDIEFPWPIARIVLEHHERLNGSGYPNGLKGEQLLLESRIIAIADVVEAISSHRPYRAAHGIEVALDEITKNKGTLYDPELVDACLRLFREKNYKLAA